MEVMQNETRIATAVISMNCMIVRWEVRRMR